MPNRLTLLVDRAVSVQQELRDRGLVDEAQVVADLVKELTTLRPLTDRPFYTSTEAAAIIGVSAQTIKNWVSRDMIKGYRVGGRIAVAREEVERYRELAASLKDLEPIPTREEVIDLIRQGRKRDL
jgi:excisionase family DNA binding protein